MPLDHFEEAQSKDVITLEKEQVEIITKVKVIKKSNTQARIFDQNYAAIYCDLYDAVALLNLFCF